MSQTRPNEERSPGLKWEREREDRRRNNPSLPTDVTDSAAAAVYLRARLPLIPPTPPQLLLQQFGRRRRRFLTCEFIAAAAAKGSESEAQHDCKYAVEKRRRKGAVESVELFPCFDGLGLERPRCDDVSGGCGVETTGSCHDKYCVTAAYAGKASNCCCGCGHRVPRE